MDNDYSTKHARLVIERPRSLVSIYRNYKIIIDNEVVGKIKNGEKITVPIIEGEHIFYVKIDWVKSNVLKFSLASNEIININIIIQKTSIIRAIFLYCFMLLGLVVGEFLGGGIGAGIGAGFSGLLLVSAITKPLVEIET